MTTRRDFLKTSLLAGTAPLYVPAHVWGANERVRVGCIGIGGKGAGDVTDVAAAGGEIVALCDVDDNRRVRRNNKDVTELFPKAKFYRDFRRMLAQEENRIDAVTVSTPDHVHCHASVMAMRMGKHVYCQKPLSHSIGEARLMTETARKYKVQTQMGNQAHAGEPIRRAVERIRAGLIGKVKEVHTWTNRPVWPQGMSKRPAPAKVPAGLDWDLWIGPAPMRPYSKDAYAPFKWRGWWDFGTGALGDMGCHIMDMPFWALELAAPTKVIATSKGNTAEAGPTASKVTYTFPAGKYCEELTFVWYDGNERPAAKILEGANLPPAQVQKQFDLVMIGEKGKLFFQRSKQNDVVFPASLLEEFKEPAKTLPRVKNEDAEWLAAILGGKPALGSFDYSGPLTETVLLGNLAIRTGTPIEWDSKNLKAKGNPTADEYIQRDYRKGWAL